MDIRYEQIWRCIIDGVQEHHSTKKRKMMGGIASHQTTLFFAILNLPMIDYLELPLAYLLPPYLWTCVDVIMLNQ